MPVTGVSKERQRRAALTLEQGTAHPPTNPDPATTAPHVLDAGHQHSHGSTIHLPDGDVDMTHLVRA